MNITTINRFKAFAGISGTSKDTLITALLPQVSSQIARYLRRDIELTTYKKWVDGNGSNILRLDNYPILQVYHVAIGSFVAATIENNGTGIRRAYVSFDGTTLVLTEISTAGVPTMTEKVVATYPTLALLKAQVDAVSGWTMTLSSSDYSAEPCTLLRPYHAQDAADGTLADLCLPNGTENINLTSAVDGVISLCRPATSERDTSFAPTAPPTFDSGFPEGIGNIFIWYKAGYTLPSDSPASDGTIPPGLELVAQQILNDVLNSRSMNSNLQSESISGYSYSRASSKDGFITSAIEARKKDLNQYRRVTL